ncbi:sensor histidine kinase [Marinicella rhabdoformis]|uniref:sensor histidine kinase n=1 Tax=Marinicella rhabdoformis TaxID=2580566 RepID=UPI0012AEBB4E|nr:HAMP domain-containing sensor histidine kinase [Marinicella rhabdoformis]
MKFKNSIKSRIIIGFLAFSSLLTSLFAVTSLSVRQSMQTDLIAQTILDDLEGYMKKFSENPEEMINQPLSTNVIGILTTPDNFHLDLPLHYADLRNGKHILKEDGRSYIVAVNKNHQIEGKPVWAYIKFDISHMNQDNTLIYGAFGGIAIIFLLLAYLLALIVSKKALKPLSDLASKLDHLTSDQTIHDMHPEPLAPYFSEDEVGKIATALDGYAEKMTDYVTRDKEFNADVSHELRTPLAVIKSTTELIASKPGLTEKEFDRINRIERAVKQSTELIETLLLLAREERKEQHDLARTQPALIIKDIIEGFEPTLRLKPVTTEVIENDWLQVKAPESVVSVVLSNLIGNAIKYTPEGVIKVIIDKNSITVLDEGIGVTESELPKLFERHYRVGKSTSKGSGIGLAIVKRLCELYNWKIDISRNQDTGLSATLTFNH